MCLIKLYTFYEYRLIMTRVRQMPSQIEVDGDLLPNRPKTK